MKWTVALLFALVLSGCPSQVSTCGACTGCCDTAGVCQPGTADQACGASGTVCVPCAANEACENNACSAVSSGGGGGTQASGGGTAMSGGGGAQGGGGGRTCVPEKDDAHCGNGIDDDCDGFIDCHDFDCSLSSTVTVCPCTPTGPENTPEACSDGIDNDCDHYVDCRDFDCSHNNPNVPACCPNRAPEDTDDSCSDGIDNDCNGFIDCKDFACSRNSAITVCDAGAPCVPTGPENTAAACANGKDDDCDGYTDCRDFNCIGTASCPVGPTPACGACDAGHDCVSGFCAYFTAFPDQRFCSSDCTFDGGQSCPPTMQCSGQGTCIPRLSYRCNANATGYAEVDDCGRTYHATACPTSEVCAVTDAGYVHCQYKPGPGAGCSKCHYGSDCASTYCSVAQGETEGYCTQRCTTLNDCRQADGTNPFDRCTPDGWCVNQTMTQLCSADNKTVEHINACGVPLYHLDCAGFLTCQYGRPTLSNPEGALDCYDPCYSLNGPVCGGGSCTTLAYEYYATTHECCEYIHPTSCVPAP
jgi:hypothetical protein